jgi:hypothetical protein
MSDPAATVPIMPSARHETLTAMFRHRPQLAAELLGGALGVELPAYEQVRLSSAELTEVVPTEYRADAVVVLSAAGSAVLAVAVEIQLRRDAQKRFSWPVYLATLRARLRCPTALLVVCVDDATARWCAAPIEIGPRSRVTPLVLGPSSVPLVTDPDQAAADPELAVLSALAHGGDPDHRDVLDALLRALVSVEDERSTMYSDLVFAGLPPPALRYLEDLMSTLREYQSDFVRKYVFQGRAEGRAESVLAVLEARGIDVDERSRTRISACTDFDQLGIWLRRAAVATSTGELFA